MCPTQLRPCSGLLGLRLGQWKIIMLLCCGVLTLTIRWPRIGSPTLHVNPSIRTKLLLSRAGTTELDGTWNGLVTNECRISMKVTIGKNEW